MTWKILLINIYRSDLENIHWAWGKRLTDLMHLTWRWQNVSSIPREAEGFESEWTMFRSDIIDSRMALDILPAKKGEICAIFGEACCTFIPINTTPDGSVTRALEGLKLLSYEVAETSETLNPFTKMMEEWSSHCLLQLLQPCWFLYGCCCIPCIREIAERRIDASITKTYSYQTVPTTEDTSESTTQ